MLVLEDESGFSLVSPFKRSWSPRGHTPTIRTSLQHHQRLNLLGALLLSPDGGKIKLMTRSYRRSLCGEQVVAFLEQLLRTVKGEIVLVWDNHPIHKRQLVQDFIAQHPRLHVSIFQPAHQSSTQSNSFGPSLAKTAPILHRTT